jgi:hypothetical protein
MRVFRFVLYSPLFGVYLFLTSEADAVNEATRIIAVNSHFCGTRSSENSLRVYACI